MILLSFTAQVVAEDPFRVSIKNAEYDSEKAQLKVEVSVGNSARRKIFLYDHGNDELLAKKRTSRKEFKFRVKNISGNDVPCEVRVESEGQSDAAEG